MLNEKTIMVDASQRRLQVVLLILIILVVAGILLFVFLQKSSSPPTPSDSVPQQKTVVLQKGNPALLTRAGVFLTLTTLSVPPNECADCLLLVEITAKRNNEVRTLTFRSGGIKGEIAKAQSAFGLVFTLKKAEKTSVVVGVEQ